VGVLGNFRGLFAALSTVAAPRMEASGVRNSWLTEPIKASRNWSVCARIVSYHIDRTTGILTENFTYHLPNGSTQSGDPTTYHCTVGSAQPTIPRFRR
jgi:hypothetical protein